MPRLKALSGEELIEIFRKFDFGVGAQKGSHVKFRRMLADGTRQIITIPLHKELDKGTLRAIYRQTLRYISEEEVRVYFYD